MQHKPHRLLQIISVLIATFTALWSAAVVWVFSTWPHLQLEELFYELRAPLTGTGGGLVFSGLVSCLVPMLLCMLLSIGILYGLKRARPSWLSRALFLMTAISIFISTASLTYVFERLNVQQYLTLRSKNHSFIEDNYVYPDAVALNFPEKKRNLIYLFLESIETTFADQASGGAFERNVIPELTELAYAHEDFSGSAPVLNAAYVPYETTWTMGAMFAHTSGLPLKINVGVNFMNKEDHFFPSLTTLGDILEREGYQQTLLIGSDAYFGGRSLYFAEHGNYDIFDYNYAIEQGLLPPDYYVWWGYEDARLFEFAKQELLRMADSEAPFNLTLLTVDSHFEDGYICQYCTDHFGEDSYSNVMACSSRQIASFIEWVQQQDFYPDTAIVLAGDHLTMDADYCAEVPPDYDRRVYTAFINAAATCETDQKRAFSTFDLFPTTLSAMGVQIEGDRLGLGTDLFSATPTLIERVGYDQMDYELRHRSLFMEYMSGISERFSHD